MTVTDLLVVSAPLLAVSLGAVKFWVSRIDKRMTRLVSVTREDLLRSIASNMAKCFEGLDKTTYVTLDYRMDGDVQCLRIPLAYNRVTECLQGMRLQLVENNAKETAYSISTLGYHSPIRLHWHYHEEMEMIQVIRGTCTDVQTGRKYGPGEIWVIEPGVRHTADFSDCYALATVRPPLPFASTHPMQFGGIEAVYNTPEPKS